MKGLKLILALVSLLAVVIAQPVLSAISTVEADVNPKLNDTQIEVGVPFVLELWMNNNSGPLQGGSWIFSLYSPDESITNIIHRKANAGTIPQDTGLFHTPYDQPYVSFYNDTSLLTYNGFYGIWDLLADFFGFGWDGNLPDTLNFSGIAIGTGWTIDDALTLYMGMALQIDEVGNFCIDSIAPENLVYDWLFDDTVNFGGPYCWEVVSTGVEDKTDDDLLPTEYNLGQNYPNPFNSTTNIEFALPSRSHVNISVFNVLGQKVRTLVDNEYDAGEYVADWDGLAEDGSEVATGIYFYKLETEKYTSTKKMMVLK